MTPSERAQRVAEIVEAALEREPSEWPSFFEESCGEDKLLRAEVESLLGYRKEATDFIEAPAYQSNADLLAEESGALKIGEQFAEYRILSLLGEGGMGEVYLAEDTKLGRPVALKLVKPGFGRANLIRHFRQEERILAGLTHPNIARLYGGGVAANGVPYFVMEYVEGERLDHYCNARQPSIPERLQLFRKICSAVSYAHQRLVIHRDLKPANVRVTAEGEPKLLDFGIAKLVDPQTESIDEPTMTLQSVMTPEYASPEQVRGEGVTTSSDIYSLGVVLYELLTGQRPYRIKSRRADEVARVISEEEPTKPSAVITQTPSAQSGFRPAAVGSRDRKSLRGDLDNIVLMAMRKEPSRRYVSVAQFSEDIRRHLEGLPVVARKDTVGYRSAKFIRRHRVGVAAALLVSVAIIAGLIAALWEARQARAQRDIARRINTFLQEMMAAAAPEAKGVDIKVIDVLGEASSRAKTELANQPEVMADVLMTLGKTYIALGEYEPAEVNLRTALAASLKGNGKWHPTTATTMVWLGLTLVYRNKVAEGEQISRQAVELERKLHPKGNEDLGVALYALGVNLIYKNEPKAAQPLLQEASGLIKKHLGETNGYYMTSLVMLARAHENADEGEVAESLYRQAIDVGGRVEARYRIYLGQAQFYLALMLINKGAYPEAETLLLQSEAIYRKVLGGDANSNVGATQSHLAMLHLLEGKLTKAEDEAKTALDLLRKYLGTDQPQTAGALSTLGLILTREGKAGEGESYLREALEIQTKVVRLDSFWIPFSESALGECLTAQQRYAEAEPLLTDGYIGLKSKLGEKDLRTIEARQRLAKLYDAWGKPERALLFQ